MQQHHAFEAKLPDSGGRSSAMGSELPCALRDTEEATVPHWGSKETYDEWIKELRRNLEALHNEAKTIDAAIMALVQMRNRKFPLVKTTGHL